MADGYTFRLNGDNTGALSAVNAVNDAFERLAKTVGGQVASTLRGAFEVTAIEETTRRVGQWANELERGSQALGITTDLMQGFSVLSQNANLDPSKVQDFFQSFSQARDAAVKGNTQAMVSLQALGVSMSDLTSSAPSSDLFGKVVANSSLGSVLPGSRESQAVENVFGQGSLPSVRAMVNQAQGQDLNQYMGSHADQIVDKGTVSQLAAQWREIVNDLKELGVAAAPLGKVGMNFVDMLINGLTGIIQFFTSILNGKWKDAATLFVSAGTGLISIGTGIVDFVTGALSKIPGLGKVKTNFTSQFQDFAHQGLQTFGLDNKNLEKHGQAAGQVLATVVGGGEVSAATKGVLTKASEGILNKAADAEIGGLTTEAEGLLNRGALLERATPSIARAVGYGGVGALVGGTNPNTTTSTTTNANLPYNAQWMTQAPFGNTGESSAMLKIGGTFGAGIQSRMLTLTEKISKNGDTVASLLAQILNATKNGNPYMAGVAPSQQQPAGLR